ncbi:glycosyltransferase family 4 protein [Ramlibacter sp. 2FC]|uniref:glycosyltransferase family 4 protein n=1 Tax=Ramlibacter sp. 2FC TaxID=2502188 RepID=UPI00201E00C3|nr:glycosyltransferase family 4 protein [Ramlibacter sp. 2FC]
MAFHTPGGGEVQIMQYQKHLLRRNVDVTLLNPWAPQFKSHDIVHFFSCMSGSLHFCSFVKSVGMPLLVSPNLWITEETKKNYPFDEIRLMFVLSDRVVCNSNAECDLLAIVFNIEREKFATVYNGIDRQFLVAADASIFRSMHGIHSPFVLNVANIEPRKNQLNLIRALKAHPDLTLIIVGHVRDAEYAKQCFEEGGEQLKYLGPLAHDSDELRSAYAACSVFALPSTLETPGLAALEAFACGAPVVVTGEGCTREYFGAGARYVDHDDVAGISNAIAESVSRRKTFLSTIVVSANFTWDKVVEHLVDVYAELQSGPQPARLQSGFHMIEQDGDSLFAWSKASAKFECQAGVINGLWRTEAGATVNISIDGNIFYRQIDIPSHWVQFQIVVPPSQDSPLRKVSIDYLKPHHKPDDIVRGVALRDVEFADARRTPSFDQLVELSALLRDSTNFYPIETDSYRYFAWCGKRGSFRSDPGHLSFMWRSLGGATVDIEIDGKPHLQGVEAGEDWSAFSLEIAPCAAGKKTEVSIVVTPSQDAPNGGRALGVAIGEIKFQSGDSPNSASGEKQTCAS